MSKNSRSQFIIATVVFLLLAASLWSGFFGVWRDRLIDLLFTAKPATNNIVIVAIDKLSIQSIGQWPWPRAVFGRVVDNLGLAGVIGIDVNFKELSGRGSADDEYFARALEP